LFILFQRLVDATIALSFLLQHLQCIYLYREEDEIIALDSVFIFRREPGFSALGTPRAGHRSEVTTVPYQFLIDASGHQPCQDLPAIKTTPPLNASFDIISTP
jgi:hypothetical protein